MTCLKKYKSLYIIFLYSCLLPFVCFMDAKDCYDNLYMNVTNYNYEPNFWTPTRHIPIYTQTEIDLDEIEFLIDMTEDCLGINLNTTCFTIYVPDDWYTSTCSGQQLFPCDIVKANNGYNICEQDKHLIVTEECPCNCRATIQDENTIITTPNLMLFGMSLVRMMSGVTNPYSEEWTRKCIFSYVFGV